jgi:hypothetical protein
MENKAMILGTNEEGYKEAGKFMMKFFYFCLITSISIVIGNIWGFILFIIGIIPLMWRKK